jgi:uncharacterized protein (UPF0335 family)
MMTIGQNTPNGQALQSIVERVERLRADRKQVTLDIGEVAAEARAAGFSPAMINRMIKIRAMKPHDRQEDEALQDSYLHALGMASETPIHRVVGLMKVDTTSRDQVIEAMKAFVPENGAITIEAGGRPVRLSRDKDGAVTATEVLETQAPSERAPARAPASSQLPEPPNVDADGAEALGDARRMRWDQGWRRESGSDGMGPGGE